MSYDLDSVYAFVKAVNAGSFSAAARELGVTPSAVSKQIARLEKRLGIALLNRTTRKLSLTEVGAVYFESCSLSLSGIEEAEETISQFRDEPQGQLKISVPQGFGRLQVARFLPQFLVLHPKIRVDLIFGRLNSHFIDENIDILIQTVDPPDTNLIVRHLASLDRITCAAPSYLERHGTPETLDDLRNHNCLMFTGSTSREREWIFYEGRKEKKVRVSGNFQTNHLDAIYTALIGGVGIAHMPDYNVMAALEAGSLLSIFPATPSMRGRRAPVSMNAYYSQAAGQLPKVKVFLDSLIGHLKANPDWRRQPMFPSA